MLLGIDVLILDTPEVGAGGSELELMLTWTILDPVSELKEKVNTLLSFKLNTREMAHSLTAQDPPSVPDTHLRRPHNHL